MSKEKETSQRFAESDVGKISLTWTEFKRLCAVLAEQIPPQRYDSLFPVLRGGVYPAVELSTLTGVPIVWELGENSLVVDDVCDSGATVSRYRAAGYDTATIHFKNRSLAPTYYAEINSAWIAYPWESDKDIESIVTRQIEYVGDDPNRRGLIETPKRAVGEWSELFRGYGVSVESILPPKPSEHANGLEPRVAAFRYDFYSTSERSMLPFFGSVWIGVLTDAENVDATALAKLVDCLSRRLQTQERFCRQIADGVENAWNPLGVFVKSRATHASLLADGAEPSEAVIECDASCGDYDKIRNDILKRSLL